MVVVAMQGACSRSCRRGRACWSLTVTVTRLPTPAAWPPGTVEYPSRAGRFGELASHLASEGLAEPCGVMFDVGVSSAQLDDARRGFSFAVDGPLDMRMDQRDASTASAWLNKAPIGEVESVIREYGEERFARRIARRVVAERPLETTAELASAVRAAVPAGHAGKHPATPRVPSDPDPPQRRNQRVGARSRCGIRCAWRGRPARDDHVPQP